MTYFYHAKYFLTKQLNKMANMIIVPVYGINSDQKFNQMKQMLFPTAGMLVQPVGTNSPGNNIQGNLIYSQINTSATGNTAFYSSLTVSAIQSLANA